MTENSSIVYLNDIEISGQKKRSHVKNAAIIIIMAISTPIAAIMAARAAGFRKSGVTRNSFAAYLMRQWSIYAGGAIGKRSIISILQNLGAKGFDSPYLIPIGFVTGATTAVVLYRHDIYTSIRRIISSPIYSRLPGKANKFVTSQIRTAWDDLRSCINAIRDRIYPNNTNK